MACMEAPSQSRRSVSLHHIRGLTESSFVEAFERDAMLADTLSYRFIVIGEASNALLGARDGDSDDLLQQYPEVGRWHPYRSLTPFRGIGV